MPVREIVPVTFVVSQALSVTAFARAGESTAHVQSFQFVDADPDVIDLVLLGLGADGHVASIFPARPALPGALVAAVRDAPKPPPDRLTLTEATLMAARSICIAGFEPEKAAILRGACQSPDAASRVPVVRIIAAHPDVTVMSTVDFAG